MSTAPVPRLAVGLWGEEQAVGPLVAVCVLVDVPSGDSLAGMRLPPAHAAAGDQLLHWARTLRVVLAHEVVKLVPRKYNSLRSKLRSRDRVLNFCYRKAIQPLLDRYPRARTVVHGVEAVGFAVLAEELAGPPPDLVYRGSADPDPGCRAASLIARGTFAEEVRILEQGLEGTRLDADVALEDLFRNLADRWGKAVISRVFKRDDPDVEKLLEE